MDYGSEEMDIFCQSVRLSSFRSRPACLGREEWGQPGASISMHGRCIEYFSVCVFSLCTTTENSRSGMPMDGGRAGGTSDGATRCLRLSGVTLMFQMALLSEEV